MTVLTLRKPPRTQVATMDPVESSSARDDARESPDDQTLFAPRQAVEFFKLLADETRLKILTLLNQRGELNVQSLCRMLDQTQPAVSHHLALLRVAGLIELRREGKHNFYHIIPERFGEIIESLRFFVPASRSWDES